MRARAAFLAGAGSAAILAIGWNASLGLTNAATSSGPVAASTSGAAGSAPSPKTTSTPSSTPAPVPAGPADGTYTGQAVGYQYGTIQVAVVISGGQITDVQNIIAQATHGRDQAFPMLLSEVLQAQSARISNLSGATYTTQAYEQAVQSALDTAGFTG
jgi:uncharacterized protein with FMN-binding domain